MDFVLSEEEKSFQKQVAEFLDREVTREAIEELESGIGVGPNIRELWRKLGAKRWLAVTWPREYGGMEGSPIQRLIIENELFYHRLPYRITGVTMAGPAILMFGTEEQKRDYLPRIASGEIDFALGYTEPQAGSDVAALDIRAVEESDCYIMNGQKVFNSACHYADYHWLAARTDPSAPKHRGISLFIVDLESPGITIRPLWVIGGLRTNEVFYDNVRVPKKNLVGEKNRGFYHMATALDLERMSPTGDAERFFNDLLEYIKVTKRGARVLAEDPHIRQSLAQVATELQVLRLLAFRVAWLFSKGIIPNYESSMLKLRKSEFLQSLSGLWLQVAGLYGQLARNSKYVLLEGRGATLYYEGIYRTITAGSSEIQRNIIATRGLKLPRD